MKIFSLFLSSLIVLFASAFAQTTTQRTPLYEIFTSSTCPPCVSGNIHFQNMVNITGNYEKMTYLKYQVNWPGNGDPYFHDDVNSRKSYYVISGVPDLIIDGQNDPYITDLNQTHIDNAYAVPSVIDLKAYYQIDESAQTVDIQIDVEALDDLPSGIYLRMAIFEYETFNNVGSNGETEFFHVVKKMIPSASGTYIGSGWTTGSTDHYDFSYTFNGSYVLPPDATDPVDYATEHTVEEFSDLGVVVWLQRASDKEIYQSTYAKLGYASVENNEQLLQSARIYPNPTEENATIAFLLAGTSDVNIAVYDQMGRVIHNEFLPQVSAERTTVQLDTKDYNEGLYLVRITSDQGEITKKLVVKH